MRNHENELPKVPEAISSDHSKDSEGAKNAPEIHCYSCKLEPTNCVETGCCGELYCWECLLSDEQCHCGTKLSSLACRPALAIRKLLERRAQRAADNSSMKTEAITQQLHPCSENCGVLVTCAELENHLKLCPEVETTCPNCLAKLKRKELVDHLENVCPLVMVSCPFDCKEQLLRSELEEHQHQNIEKHLQMLLNKVEEIKSLSCRKEPDSQLCKVMHEKCGAAVLHVRQSCIAKTVSSAAQAIKDNFSFKKMIFWCFLVVVYGLVPLFRETRFVLASLVLIGVFCLFCSRAAKKTHECRRGWSNGWLLLCVAFCMVGFALCKSFRFVV